MNVYFARIRSAFLPVFLSGSLLMAGQPDTVTVPPAPSPAPSAAPSMDTLNQAPGLQLRSLNALAEFEGAAGQEYTIGDGDELDIQAVGRPEISGSQLVGPDGRITLPLYGSFDVHNMTREAAAKAIAEIFEKYYTSVDVTVRVSKYGSNRIYVLGHIQHPGVLYFEGAPTLLEALTKSTATQNGTESSLPPRCAIFRGKEQAVWIDLRAMMEYEGSIVNLRLRRDDVLYIPDEHDDMVSVLGEVQRPGMVKLQPKTTVLELLALAGGLTGNAGSAKIEIYRPGAEIAQEVAFKDLLNPQKLIEVRLQQGDVIYVQKGTAAKLGYAIQQLAPLSGILLFGATIGR